LFIERIIYKKKNLLFDNKKIREREAMRCTLCPTTDLDVRVDAKARGKNETTYSFCSPLGEIYTIVRALNSSSEYYYCKNPSYRGQNEYYAEKEFYALQPIAWLNVPEMIRRKIWLILTKQEENNYYDEEEANFVYYGEREEYIWAATHCVHNLIVTMEIVKEIGGFSKHKYIGCKHYLKGDESNDYQYLLDENKLVTVHVGSRKVSYKIESWLNYLTKKKKREQWILDLARTAEMPLEIAKLVSLPISKTGKALETLKALKEHRLEIRKLVKEEQSQHINYFLWEGIVGILPKVLGNDVVKTLDLSDRETPDILTNYIMD
jgi:hypothetical protein